MQIRSLWRHGTERRFRWRPQRPLTLKKREKRQDETSGFQVLINSDSQKRAWPGFISMSINHGLLNAINNCIIGKAIIMRVMH